ncbi:MAG: SusC/RagA family TonB-linked outer membrane protein [Tannerella sp.]|jgi:TonB-linked SusC/RagA family outer membrane protein|nr:SusC/RagA family TonB-linked outer membrane protein [Tannerella sp.]
MFKLNLSKVLWGLILFFTLFLDVDAQTGFLKGSIKDFSGNPLIGVNVTQKGTANGTATDADGNFVIDVPANATLVFSYIGFVSKEEDRNGVDFMRITLFEDTKLLSEVVVTALGIKREEKSLGYAVQKMEGTVFEKAVDPNLINSLAGKVSGLKINTASELFNSSEISLRGEQPVIIIDGTSTEISYWDLNFNDIEELTVLKGASAAALYGSEGRNGAIVITTKRGRKDITRVEFNSTNMLQPSLMTYPKTQTSFGTGNNGVYEYVDGSGSGIEGGGFNWGPKLDRRLIKQWNSPVDATTGERIPVTWEDKTNGKGNLVSFLEKGFTTTNNINIETGNSKGTFRISVSNSYQKGIVPNTKLNTWGLGVAGNYDVFKWYNINTSLNYSRHDSPNYRTPSYGPHDYIYSLMFWLGSDIDLEDAKNYWEPGKENIQQRFQQLGYYNNPYLLSYENLHTYDKNSMYGQITNTFKIIPDALSFLARAGFNNYGLETSERVPKSMIYYGQKSRGDFIVNNSSFFRINTDLILTYDKSFTENIKLNTLLGFSNIYEKNKSLTASTDGLSIPGLFTLSNSQNPVINSNSLYEQRISGLYANLNLQFYRPIYLSLTARNDWVSTLPTNANSFLYPSASLSYVISDMLKMPSFINFFKIRGSWMQVNSGWTGSVYGHIPTYTIGSFNNLPALSLSGTLLSSGLEPSGSITLETGGDIRLFKDLIRLDFSFYRKAEYNNIISQQVSEASGYSTMKVNGREYTRKGFEFLLNIKPVDKNDIRWDFNINLSQSHQYLTELEDGKNRDGFIKLNTRTDQIYKLSWMKSPDGKYIYDSNGLPVRDVFQRFAGYFDPDFIYGFYNNLRYKQFNLSFLLEGQVGGLYYSILPRMGRAGTSASLLDLKYMEDAANGLKNYIADGVVVTGGEILYDFEGNITKDTRTFAPNTTAISYQDWAKSFYNLGDAYAETYLDASYLKFREISIGYSLPNELLGNLFLKSAMVSVVGSNLFIITKKQSKGDDPSWRNNNLKSPTPVSVGVNLNLKF